MALNRKGRDILYNWAHFMCNQDSKKDLEKIPKAIRIINKSIFTTGFLTYQEYIAYNRVTIAEEVLYKYSVYKELKREININKVLNYLSFSYFTRITFQNNIYYISQDGIYNSKFEPLLVMGYYNNLCIKEDELCYNDKCNCYIYKFTPTLLVNAEVYSECTNYLNNQILKYIIPYIASSVNILTLSNAKIIRLLHKVKKGYNGKKYLDTLAKACGNELDTSWIIS